MSDLPKHCPVCKVRDNSITAKECADIACPLKLVSQFKVTTEIIDYTDIVYSGYSDLFDDHSPIPMDNSLLSQVYYWKDANPIEDSIKTHYSVPPDIKVTAISNRFKDVLLSPRSIWSTRDELIPRDMYRIPFYDPTLIQKITDDGRKIMRDIAYKFSDKDTDSILEIPNENPDIHTRTLTIPSPDSPIASCITNKDEDDLPINTGYGTFILKKGETLIVDPHGVILTSAEGISSWVAIRKEQLE